MDDSPAKWSFHREDREETISLLDDFIRHSDHSSSSGLKPRPSTSCAGETITNA